MGCIRKGDRIILLIKHGLKHFDAATELENHRRARPGAAGLLPCACGHRECAFTLANADGQKVSGCLNPKTTWRALSRLAELGADKAAAIMQGQLARGGRIEAAGLAVQPKAGPEKSGS
jgi:hypothetical protein